MRLRGFHHLAIFAHDLELVAGFWRDVLGVPEKVRHLNDDGSLRSIWLDLGDAFIAVERAPDRREETPHAEGRAGYHLFALRIAAADRASVEATLRDRGVSVDKASRWTLYVRDPEGNRIGLSHHPDDL